MNELLSKDRYCVSQPLSITECEFIHNNDQLKIIQFSRFKPDQKTLQLLNEMVFRDRKDIILRVYGSNCDWRDISFLSEVSELEMFEWETEEFGPVAPLYHLKKITRLGLGMNIPKNKISLKFLLDFTDDLTELRLAGDYKDVESVISKIKRLRTIYFSSTKLNNLRFLEGLSIENFGNYGSKANGFSDLPMLRSIKTLWLKKNSRLENIDFIKDLTALEEIDLHYLGKILSIPNIAHLKQLNKITILDCNRLEDISEVMKLQRCKIYASGAKIPGKFYRYP